MSNDTLLGIYLAPWLLLLPYGFYFLVRRNYRANSGLCVACGSKVQDLDTCTMCRKAAGKGAKLKTILTIIFVFWVFTSIAWLRHRVLVGS